MDRTGAHTHGCFYELGSPLGRCPDNGSPTLFWIAVKELSLNYDNSNTICLSIYPYHGNLKYKFRNGNPVLGADIWAPCFRKLHTVTSPKGRFRPSAASAAGAPFQERSAVLTWRFPKLGAPFRASL